MTHRLIMRQGSDRFRFAMDVEQVVRTAPASPAVPLPHADTTVEGLAIYGSDVAPKSALQLPWVCRNPLCRDSM